MKKLLKKLIPDWLLSLYHWKLALLGAVVYGFPSRKIKVIGVTGTKGKSTVVMLAGKVLSEIQNTKSPLTPPKGGEGLPPFREGGGGFSPKVGWISSLTIFDGQNEVMNPFHMTMPGRFFIQKTLAQMVKNGCQYALVEVTSEGIKQSRHRFIKWAGAVFTNLAPEHLEAHGGFENYRAAKMKLFQAAAKNKESFGVYNLDDENVKWFQKYPVGKKYGYGALSKEILKDHFATLVMTDVKLSASGSEFKINNTQFKINLLGEFNVYNCAAAAAVGMACEISPEESSRALAKVLAIPGRLELINEGQPFSVIVDLAHTPDSYEKVFRLFNELKNSSSPQTRGGLRWGDENKNIITSPGPSSTEEGRQRPRIISVFGSAGGGRDKWKRPELGRLASQYSDQLFITNEDPYDEDPLTIANEILAGCDEAKTDIILDRRSAIARALSLARTGDIVLILGKGTEQTYVEGNKKSAWDDRVVTREEINKLVP